MINSACPPPANNLQRLPALASLRAMTQGLPALRIGLIDGWIDVDHEVLRSARVFQDARDAEGECAIAPPSAQATFAASLLVGGRGLGLCDACSLLSLPVADGDYQSGRLAPALRAQRVAQAIRRGVDWGAHVLVLGAAAVPFTAALERACDAAARAGVRVIALTDVKHQAPRRAWVAVTPGDASGRAGAMAARLDVLRVPMVELVGAALPSGCVALRTASGALAYLTASFVLLAALRRDLPPARIWAALLRPHDALRGPGVLDVSAALLSLAAAGQDGDPVVAAGARTGLGVCSSATGNASSDASSHASTGACSTPAVDHYPAGMAFVSTGCSATHHPALSSACSPANSTDHGPDRADLQLDPSPSAPRRQPSTHAITL